ncbi:MAG TPA: hypothetical protein VK569_09985, partial [Bacteroidota bacterium]|nr:hypothetical protein [Bacteroidota bacterium]
MNRWTLAFTGGQGLLEKEFLDDYNQASLKEIRMSVLVGAVIICLFAILDEFVLPTEKYVMWMLRCASLIPAVVLLYLLTYWKGIRRFLPLAQSVALLLTGVGALAMILRAPAPANFVYSSGLVLIVMFGFTVLRLRFIWGTIVGWAVVLA